MQIPVTNKKTIFTLLLFLAIGNSYATHYRAGEIIYSHTAGLTYEVTVITYTDPKNANADRDFVKVDWNDKPGGNLETVARSGKFNLTVNQNYLLQKNEYKTSHTFTGNGVYVIKFADPNRVEGIKNMDNSVGTAFYIESKIFVSNFFYNQSPQLLHPPIDRGCVGYVFTHNPSAYDPDGDSLVFTLIPPKLAEGIDVLNYRTPDFTKKFELNPRTGQLIWDAPKFDGTYNIAIRIEEFRNGVSVGFVIRDMQILISICSNQPPIIADISSDCIIAGEKLSRFITANDPDIPDLVLLTKYGGPFVQKRSPAYTIPDSALGNPASFMFYWTPDCRAIRKNPFQVDFKAADKAAFNPLTFINNYSIRVIAPAVKDVQIKQDSNGLKISWQKDSCGLAYGYKVYRRIDSSKWNPQYCQTGVAASANFKLLAINKGQSNITFFDNNFGKGLSPLIRYCYRITAFYPTLDDDGNIVLFSDTNESKSSIEVCDLIGLTKPVITNVSVRNTDLNNGSIYIHWLKPSELNTTQFGPPYKVILKRALMNENNYNIVGTPFIYLTFQELTDTSFIDTNLNTTSNQYKYKVELYFTQNCQEKYACESVLASSVFVKNINTNRSIVLNYSFDVPWQNENYIVYRKNKSSNLFDSIANTTNLFYIDTGLNNGSEYCYFVSSIGNFNNAVYPNTLINNSEIICGIPIDTTPPCPPLLLHQTPCDVFNDYNVKLSWTYPINCEQDILKFKLYYRKNENDIWETLIDSLPKDVFNFTDDRDHLKKTIAGCYSVTAIDTNGNESSKQNAFCIDNCPYYVIPNVFTPNKDGQNDLLRPFPYRFIDRIDLSIYNRWGQLVFHTVDPEINWDGKNQDSNHDLTEGVYFYICNVFESYLEGVKKRNLRGSITLIR